MTNYSEQQLQEQLKPYSQNGFVAFFQKIWRGWLSAWYGFSDKHPTLANLIYMVFFFIVFSEGVTIFQFLVMTFLPYAFEPMWSQPFVWPAIELPWKDAAGNALNYAIFNEPVKFLTAEGKTILASTAEQVAAAQAVEGNVLQVAGLGNFIAFEIATFLAQVINFPLQRNITYRSHGNPWYQAMWYFIGWVLVSIFTNAVWGIMNPLMMWWNWNEVVIGLIKTVLTGGVSMAIFFFVFLILFPDNKKMADKAKAKLEKLQAEGASAEAIAKAEAAYKKAQDILDRSVAEKDRATSVSLAGAKIMKYFAAVKNLPAAEQAAASAKESLDNAKAGEDAEALAQNVETYSAAQTEAIEAKQKVDEAYREACEAVDNKIEKEAAYVATMERLGLPVKA